MVWGDQKIKERIFETGKIQNADVRQINPASVNLRLGNTFLTPIPNRLIRLGDEMQYKRHEVIAGRTVVIEPGEFVLATTKEYIEIPTDAAAFVQGRSSIGRIGLTVQNAGFVDPGFHGHITLELVNESGCHIELIPGYPVAQLVFFDSSPVECSYCGKYNDQVEATGSRMFLDNIPDSWKK